MRLLIYCILSMLSLPRRELVANVEGHVLGFIDARAETEKSLFSEIFRVLVILV